MKDSLWNIVNGTEHPPPRSETQKYNKYVARRDKALAILVLSVDQTLL